MITTGQAYRHGAAGCMTARYRTQKWPRYQRWHRERREHSYEQSGQGTKPLRRL